MKIRNIYIFTLLLFIWGAYTACHVLIPDMNELHYISLLFSTLALMLVYLFPPLYSKGLHSARWMRFKLYLCTVPYALLVWVLSYLFSFQFRMNPSFYFLVHILMLLVELLLLAATSSTAKRETAPNDIEA